MTCIMRMNAQMRKLKREIEGLRAFSLDPNLAGIIRRGFVELNGCTVFAQFQSSAQSVTVADCFDETGYESFINHLHVEDYLDSSFSPLERVAQGFTLTSVLARSLESHYPSITFRILLSCSSSGCSVRFHTLRPGQQWIRDDLESYLDEALAVLTTKATADHDKHRPPGPSATR